MSDFFDVPVIREGCILEVLGFDYYAEGSADFEVTSAGEVGYGERYMSYCHIKANSAGNISVAAAMDGSSVVYFNFTVNDDLTISETINYDKPSGDVDFDGAISESDVSELQKYLQGGSSFSHLKLEAADVDNNLRVNVFDLLTMKRNLMK